MPLRSTIPLSILLFIVAACSSFTTAPTAAPPTIAALPEGQQQPRAPMISQLDGAMTAVYAGACEDKGAACNAVQIVAADALAHTTARIGAGDDHHVTADSASVFVSYHYETNDLASLAMETNAARFLCEVRRAGFAGQVNVVIRAFYTTGGQWKEVMACIPPELLATLDCRAPWVDFGALPYRFCG